MVELSDEIRQELSEEFEKISFSYIKEEKVILENIKEADVLITYGDHLKREFIEKAQKLKWIMVLTAGIEQVPRDLVIERNIIVTNVKGIHKTPMVEYAMLMMIQTLRHNKTMIEDEQNHTWDKMKYVESIDEITGKNLAIIGTGEIGQKIAEVAKAFQMKTHGYNSSGRSVPYFDVIWTGDAIFNMLEQVDIVISILPSTPDTKGFLHAKHFQSMKNDAVFINIGRGDTVNEGDLILTLEKGDIAHAVLDVVEQEPLDSSHPFWSMKNVTITPHIAGVSINYHVRAIEIFKQNLRKYASGTTEGFRNVIDCERGY
ncbi:D-2-hydroxyacid dehydrogenase [Alkalihalobacillus sp. MEB130]|uniref:D-2-hydroxyacid dehydrogenase n=1 Tax=Alkalihalobacillus sp. MEB130 TaxID=2976704 RepID=UPI0028E06AFB|nr:D-2-hydroxyacid dehydrogenase [Alkalihalobacillus sp. MEB130]MDT8860724.1 D-2-hydroxyacid dehydrogenase [Alkalihalobacillus sp. MEB130]